MTNNEWHFNTLYLSFWHNVQFQCSIFIWILSLSKKRHFDNFYFVCGVNCETLHETGGVCVDKSVLRAECENIVYWERFCESTPFRGSHCKHVKCLIFFLYGALQTLIALWLCVGLSGDFSLLRACVYLDIEALGHPVPKRIAPKLLPTGTHSMCRKTWDCCVLRPAEFEESVHDALAYLWCLPHLKACSIWNKF